MKRLLAHFAALLAVTPAFAQPPELRDADKVMSLGMDGLTALMADAGWKTEAFETDSGLEGLGVKIGSRELVLIPTACSSDGRCKGLYTYALIPDNPGAADLNKFNLTYNPARATAQNGTLILDNYVVGDYGVVRGSLAVDLLVQANLIDAWWQFRQGGGKTSAPDLSNSVAFTPVSGADLSNRWQRPDLNALGLPDAAKFSMLQANARRINQVD